MSNNPNFIANMSSDEVYFGQDTTLCLTDVVDAKADIDHIHNGYASSTHSHVGYASQSDLDLLEDVINTKANISHTHIDYASTSHEHDDYATTIALDMIGEEVNNKADVNHTHMEYASISHEHDDLYASSNHNHNASYAQIGHAHNDYATTSDLNEVTVTVSGKANASHTHDDRYYTETEVNTKLANKSDISHLHTGVYDASGAAENALTSANAYTDSKIDALVGDGASTTLDTIGEISSAIEDNQDAIDLLNSAIGNKVNVSDFTSHSSNKSNPHNVTLAQLGVTATANELNHVDGVISSIQTQLDGKASSGHTHNYAGSSSAGGVATSANKLSTARNISLTGDVTGSTSFDGSGNVSITATIADDSHNHVISNVDGLQSALDGKSATNHNHDSAYIKKALQFTADNGAHKLSYNKDDGKNILTEFAALTTGFYTAYSQSGTAGNPKTTEAWRFMIHKTGNNTGWVQGYGSLGSVYTNYQDGNSGWRGWRCIWDNDPNPLWSGAMYMSSSNGTPQTVKPSKKLSECRTGWLLLWSDYDPGGSANDADFATTMIPKNNPSGSTWGGKSFLCDIPRYVGSNSEDVDTERRIIKPIYVHNDRIEGSYQNAYDERNDVVLRAVYEF